LPAESLLGWLVTTHVDVSHARFSAVAFNGLRSAWAEPFRRMLAPLPNWPIALVVPYNLDRRL
jgi:hypothetical protein